MTQINNFLFKIDDILFNKGIHMDSPVIDEDLGALIYFATRYKTTSKEIFKEKSILLLNKLIEVFPNKNLMSSFTEGFEGIYWTVHYLYKCKIIGSEDITNDIDDFLFESIRIDIKTNNFDLLHGYIGKIQYLIHSNKHDKNKISILINEIVNSLYINSKEFNGGIFWLDAENTKKTYINFGIAHGIPSVLIFLVKLHEIGHKNPLILTMINGIVKTLFNFRNTLNETSSFADGYILNESGNSYSCEDRLSRLGWCYGDLGVSYSIYYAGLVLNNDLWKEEATNITKNA